MPGFDDEEPEVYERSWEESLVAEAEFAKGHCYRCGVAGHKEADCPTVTPDLLREDAEAIKAKRRVRAHHANKREEGE